MANNITCDACGGGDAGEINISIFGNGMPPEGWNGATQKCDLCRKCVGKLFAAIKLIWPYK